MAPWHNRHVGTEGRRLPRRQGSSGVVVYRRRRGWDETEDEGTTRGVSLALNRPAHARAGDIVALQRLAGNEAVVQLAAHTAGPTAEATEAAEVNPPPGPYTGRRLRNDKMDAFEDQTNVFGPAIFKHYSPYWELWAPLASLLDAYWLGGSRDAGIRLENADQRVNAWVIVERFNAQKAAYIRQHKPGRRRDVALLDAVWGELGRQYMFAHDRCHAAWLHSNFRLFHEWLAVRFDRVEAPYAYWANRARAP